MATSSVAAAAGAVLGPAVPVATSGARFDATDVDAWVDLDVETWTGRVGRASGRLEGVTVIARVFVRAGADVYEARALADRVRSAFDGRTVEVVDHDLSARPAVGVLRFGEAAVRDLTRSSATVRELNQVTLTWRATAQPVVFV